MGARSEWGIRVVKNRLLKRHEEARKRAVAMLYLCCLGIFLSRNGRLKPNLQTSLLLLYKQPASIKSHTITKADAATI